MGAIPAAASRPSRAESAFAGGLPAAPSGEARFGAAHPLRPPSPQTVTVDADAPYTDACQASKRPSSA
jgi:hypothetical protein